MLRSNFFSSTRMVVAAFVATLAMASLSANADTLSFGTLAGTAFAETAQASGDDAHRSGLAFGSVTPGSGLPPGKLNDGHIQLKHGCVARNGSDVECGDDSDVRRYDVPDGTFGNHWQPVRQGGNVALGARALASGPAWTDHAIPIGQTHGVDGGALAVWDHASLDACNGIMAPAQEGGERNPCDEIVPGELILDQYGEPISPWGSAINDVLERIGIPRSADYFARDEYGEYTDVATSGESDLSWNTAVGTGADARGYRSANVAMGHGAEAWGHGVWDGDPEDDLSGQTAANIAIGRMANASGAYESNIAIGNEAKASGESMALGRGATASNDSVAIGNGVRADDGEVRIGTVGQSVYIGGRDIQAEFEGLDERISQANAAAAAFSAVPNAPLNKGFMVGFGVGNHDSETAVALGAAGRFGKEGGLTFNGGVANTGDGTTARLGVGLAW